MTTTRKLERIVEIARATVFEIAGSEWLGNTDSAAAVTRGVFRKLDEIAAVAGGALEELAIDGDPTAPKCEEECADCDARKPGRCDEHLAPPPDSLATLKAPLRHCPRCGEWFSTAAGVYNEETSNLPTPEETDMKNLHRALKTICGIAGLPHAAATQRMDEVFSLARYALAELDRESESIGPWPSGALKAAILDIERSQRAEHLDRVAGVIEDGVEFIRDQLRDHHGTEDIVVMEPEATNRWVLDLFASIAEELRKT